LEVNMIKKFNKQAELHFMGRAGKYFAFAFIILLPLKNKLLLAIMPLLLIVVLACEKVIDVDLNDSEPEIVIEANLSNNNGALEVKITKTGSYFDSAPVEKVTNADVFLEGGPGYRLKVKEMSEGLYQLDDLPLNIGAIYRLQVFAEGKEYTAVSMLNQEVKIDSLGIEYQREERFFDGGYRLLLFFSDPPEKENYYRVKIYRNGLLFNSPNDLIIFEDSDLDGKGIQVRLRGQLFEPGDKAQVELYSIDRHTWEYFSSLRDLINLNPGSPAPANPISGFSNGALGYFSAWSLNTKELVIPD